VNYILPAAAQREYCMINQISKATFACRSNQPKRYQDLLIKHIDSSFSLPE